MASSGTSLNEAACETSLHVVPLDNSNDGDAAAAPVLARTRRVPYVCGDGSGGTGVRGGGSRVKATKHAAAEVDRPHRLRRALNWMFPRAGGVRTAVFRASSAVSWHRNCPLSSLPSGVPSGVTETSGTRGLPERRALINGVASDEATEVAAASDALSTVVAASSPPPLSPMSLTADDSGGATALAPRDSAQEIHEEPLSREDPRDAHTDERAIATAAVQSGGATALAPRDSAQESYEEQRLRENPRDAHTDARSTAMAAMNDGDDDAGLVRAATPDSTELEEPSDVGSTFPMAAIRMKARFEDVLRQRQAAVSHRPPRATRGVLY